MNIFVLDLNIARWTRRRRPLWLDDPTLLAGIAFDSRTS